MIGIIVGIFSFIFFIVCTCCYICRKKKPNQNETFNARFIAAAAAAAAAAGSSTTTAVTGPNTNNSQVNFNRGESVISYDAALRNSTLVNQPINQTNFDDLNECKLPTYEEVTSK